MPNQVNKHDLPQKICPTCARPFTWRKKWEKVWDDIRYCSARCRRDKKNPADASGRSEIVITRAGTQKAKP